jgi:hypothetical protein
MSPPRWKVILAWFLFQDSSPQWLQRHPFDLYGSFPASWTSFSNAVVSFQRELAFLFGNAAFLET